MGSFTQADSIIPAGAQGLDRYAYVNNAPVNLTDPSGHMVSDGLIGEGGGCDRLCLDSLGSRDESGDEEDREDNAKSSLGDIHGGNKNPGLSSPVSVKNCEGLSGFSYCKYLDDTYVVLEWNGQYIQVNLAELDLTNDEDLKIFLAVNAYTDAADKFQASVNPISYDLIIFSVGIVFGIGGAISCIPTASAGCGGFVAGTIVSVAEAEKIQIELKAIMDAKQIGEEKFNFLLNNPSGKIK